VISGEISGVSQVPLANETFEDDERFQNSGNVTFGGGGGGGGQTPFQVAGHSGHGLRIEARDRSITFPADEQQLAIHFAKDDRSKRLVIRRGGSQGFYLAAAVRTPMVDDPAVFDSATGRISPRGEPTYLPVVVLGSDTTQDVSESVAGLMLRRHLRPMQIVDRWDAATKTAQKEQFLAAPLATWEAIGWVLGDGEGGMVSSINDLQYMQAIGGSQPGPTTGLLHMTASWSNYSRLYPTMTRSDPLGAIFQGQQQQTWNDPALDVPCPIGDGRWVDLGLLFDGRQLVLFINGVPIARADAQVTLPLDDARNTLWVGTASLPNLGTDPSSGGTVYAAAPTVLDDVRLLRLGTDRPVPLPQGVRPCLVTTDTCYEIVLLPDGRASLYLTRRNARGTSTMRTTTMIMAETGEPEFATDPLAIPARHLAIQIDTRGILTSTLVPLEGGAKPVNLP
jgi:hypothetical protein